MDSRRTFLKGLAGAGVALPLMRENAFAQLFKANAIAGNRPPLAVAEDETYWSQIQRAFDADRTMINLNNGGISPAPTYNRRPGRLIRRRPTIARSLPTIFSSSFSTCRPSGCFSA